LLPDGNRVGLPPDGYTGASLIPGMMRVAQAAADVRLTNQAGDLMAIRPEMTTPCSGVLPADTVSPEKYLRPDLLHRGIQRPAGTTCA